MFYYNYVNLCNERGISPSAAAEEIGFHRSDVTRWSKNSRPRQSTLQKVANYFGVPVSALVGDQKGQETDEKEKPTENGELSLDDIMEILRPLPRDELVDIAARVMELLKEK